MALSMSEAERVADAAVEEAKKKGIRISVAVCDAGGRLVVFKRMDGAIWASALGSQGKAIASAAFNRPSGEVEKRADLPTIRGIVAAEGGHMIPGRGAVPLRRGGELIGACGVGGGTSEEDEECARAGAEVLRSGG